MPDPVKIARLRRDRDAAAAQMIASERELQAVDRAIADATRTGDKEAARRLAQQRRKAERAGEKGRRNFDRARDAAGAGLNELLGQSQERLVQSLADDAPIVLFPVRLETRFAQGRRGPELRVRIFPDDIMIAAPPEAISEAEQQAAIAYWRARVASKAAPDDEALRRSYEGAWTAFATRHGVNRAAFLVSELSPVDPKVAPDLLEFADPPAPAEPPTPRADVLPDRFAVLGLVGGKKVFEIVGKAIPDDLALAPNAAQSETWLTRDEATGKLNVPPSLQWLVDFDAAVDVGMGVRVPLNEAQARGGVDRLLAIGVRSATPASQGPALLESLVAKHHYGQGCGVLRAGTPTNNTESARSGWRPPSSDSEQMFAILDSPPDITPQPGLLGTSDGWRLAHLFGLSADLIATLPNAQATDIAEARAMNQALAPGTLDDFVAEFLHTIVPEDAAAALHDYFVGRVTGRGAYPAIRVGKQPYGLVVTSHWTNWAYNERRPGIGAEITALIKRHRDAWDQLADQVPRTARSSADPFQRLLDIIGLLASSAAFVSRKAVSDQYVRARLGFGGTRPEVIQRWFARLTADRAQNLAAAGIAAGADPVDPLIAHVAFLDHVDPWRLPIIDRDPTVPLSERDAIQRFDATRNYLDWLAAASRADLVSQRFTGSDGASVPVPSALLYRLLRLSLLAAVEHGSLKAAGQFGSRLFDVIGRDPPIANIGASQHVLRKDYLEVDAAVLGLTNHRLAVADWALASGRAGGLAQDSPAARIAEVHEAIAALAKLPTARLERLFAESLDLCSYRLDAWISALYNERLELILDRQRARSFLLGAYGWVENLRPSRSRTAVAAEDLPSSLRGEPGRTVFVDRANGGFIHAPSLNQAASASVLRNAYLSHAASDSPETFAVNLSSARMRRATALAQGIRAGQPLAALLGYQIERGLHEGHPGIELDQYIYDLRDRFPLSAGQLTTITPGSAQVSEARNVVNGLDLLEHVEAKDYPWGITSLPASSTAAGKAIGMEVDLAKDAVDALADLLLSETVHQAVQGNMERTKASLQALAEPEAPPDPEIIRTPRSGTVFTFRVALALDVNATAGWTPSLSPRASANPQLNAWLATHLPPANDIQWQARIGGGPAISGSLDGLGLEPLDVVLLAGDGAADLSSELIRFIVERFREAHAVADDLTTVTGKISADPAKLVQFDFATSGAGTTSLASLFPLLTRFRRLITAGRPADARDFWRAADMDRADPEDPAGTASGDPKLIGYAELSSRLDAAIIGLDGAGSALKTAWDAAAPLLSALKANPATVSDPAWPGALTAIRVALRSAQKFGIVEASPAEGLAANRGTIERLVGQAAAVLAIIAQRSAEAKRLRATTFTEPLPAEQPERGLEEARRNDVLRTAYRDCAQAIFGSSYIILPLFRLMTAQAGELSQALASPPVADPLAVPAWNAAAARVRPRMADLALINAGSNWVGRPMAEPDLLQLPFSAGARWVGGALGPDLPRAEWLSLSVLDGAKLVQPLAAALMIDDWTETMPAAHEVTGVAFNFDRPNATAPQALLVAVPPVARGHWEWEDVIGSVQEALDLARLRAVEPDQLLDRKQGESSPRGDFFQTLPAILSEFTTARLATAHFAAAAAATVRKDV